MQYILLGTVLTTACGALFSQQKLLTVASPHSTPPATQTNVEMASRFQVGANYTYAHIKPSGHSATHGNIGGMQALYEFRAPNRIYGGVAFAWRQGETEGKGGERFLRDYDVEERIGYTIANSEDTWRVTLFSGFGYRHLGEKVRTHGSPVTFNYNEFYIPLAFLVEGKVSSLVSLGFNFQWMPQVYSTVTIVPLKGARWIIDNRVDNFMVELPLTVQVSRKHHLSMMFVPFFELWHDGDTDAKTATGVSLDVPSNTYLFAGLNVNLCYSF